MSNPRNATTTSRGRTYLWRDETFTSVTTILSGGVPKPALKPWGEKLVATTAVKKRAIWRDMTDDEAIDWLKRAPFRETDRAAAQGSDVHDWAERHVLGQPVTVEAAPEAQRGYLDGFLHFIGELKPTWEMTEASVYNREYGYAGTLDALLTLRGDVADATGLHGLGLVDYKTTKSGIFPETALQLAAYRHAEFVGLRDGTEIPMPEIGWCGALWLTPTGYHLIPIDAGPVAFEYFLHAHAVRDFSVDVGKLLLAPAVALPQPPARPSAPPNVLALTD